MKDDAISRQGVLKLLSTIPPEEAMTKAMLIQSVKQMDAAQPERKRGKWEFYEDRAPVWDIAGEKTWARAYKCSECGFVHSVIEDFGRYGFCPNCGADMREASK